MSIRGNLSASVRGFAISSQVEECAPYPLDGSTPVPVLTHARSLFPILPVIRDVRPPHATMMHARLNASTLCFGFIPSRSYSRRCHSTAKMRDHSRTYIPAHSHAADHKAHAKPNHALIVQGCVRLARSSRMRRRSGTRAHWRHSALARLTLSPPRAVPPYY